MKIMKTPSTKSQGFRCQVSGFRLNIGVSEKALLWRLHHFNVKASEITLIIADTRNLTPDT